MTTISIRKTAAKRILLGATMVLFGAAGMAGVAQAKKGDGCTGGSYVVTGFSNGAQLGTAGRRTTVAASIIQPTLTVTGRFNTFEVDSATFAVRNYAFTGAASPQDMTGGRRTVVWQEKTPDHRGLTLNRGMVVEVGEEGLSLTRTGNGVTVKIQAKDCAAGGIFQMEIERGDGTATRVTHVLAPGIFYYDNPRFRAREGDIVPYKDTSLAVTPRVNIGSDTAARFVARDSAQVATRVDEPTCSNAIPTRTGGTATVRHCGSVSRWDIASGGRMGFVTGEDATEVAPPATVCTHKCGAQNRVRGRAVVLGAPFPVPEASRLKPGQP